MNKFTTGDRVQAYSQAYPEDKGTVVGIREVVSYEYFIQWDDGSENLWCGAEDITEAIE